MDQANRLINSLQDNKERWIKSAAEFKSLKQRLVGDVAKALVKSTEKACEGVVFPVAVEIGPSENKTVGEIAQLIKEIANSDSEITNLPMRPGENAGDKVTANNETLKYVDMTPDQLVSLEEGMRRTVEYFNEYLKTTNQK